MKRNMIYVFLSVLSLAANALAAPKVPSCDKTLTAYEASYLNSKDSAGMLPSEKLLYQPRSDAYLSTAEQVAIAIYTIDGTMELRIMYCGASKLPPVARTLFRGQSKKGSTIAKEGQIISMSRIVSTSSSQSVAEGFLGDPAASELWIIHAKSARDISKYSQNHPEGISEEEHFLLPGTRLVVDKIFDAPINFFDERKNKDVPYQVRHVELREI